MGCNIYYLFIYLFLVLLLLYTYLGHKLKFNRTPLIVDTIRYWNVVYLIPIPNQRMTSQFSIYMVIEFELEEFVQIISILSAFLIFAITDIYLGNIDQ